MNFWKSTIALTHEMCQLTTLWKVFVRVHAVGVSKKGTLKITKWPIAMSNTYVNQVPLLSSQDSFGLLMLSPLSAFIFAVQSPSTSKLISNFASFSYAGPYAVKSKLWRSITHVMYVKPLITGLISYFIYVRMKIPRELWWNLHRSLRGNLCVCGICCVNFTRGQRLRSHSGVALIHFASVQAKIQDGCKSKDEEDYQKASSPSHFECFCHVWPEPNSRI